MVGIEWEVFHLMRKWGKKGNIKDKLYIVIIIMSFLYLKFGYCSYQMYQDNIISED